MLSELDRVYVSTSVSPNVVKQRGCCSRGYDSELCLPPEYDRAHQLSETLMSWSYLDKTGYGDLPLSLTVVGAGSGTPESCLRDPKGLPLFSFRCLFCAFFTLVL